VVSAKYFCKVCGNKEDVAIAVMRSVREFQQLFPKRKITTKVIHKWCSEMESQRRIQKILGNNFNTVGTRRWSYYANVQYFSNYLFSASLII
jgi:hypothetical protein